MTAKSQSIPIDILEEVIKCIQSVGKGITLRGIRQISVSNWKEKEKSEIIVNAVCEQMNISRHALLNGRSNGTRVQATMYLYVLHTVHLGCDVDEIRNIFFKDYESVRQRLKAFEKLDSASRYDESVLKQYNQINELVKQRINGKR